VEKPSVAPTGPGPARLGLDQDDLERRLSLLQFERSPEPCVTASDNADVSLVGSLEGGLRLERTRFVEPPGRQPRRDAQAVLVRRIWMSTFASIPITATAKIAVPITFTCGGAPTRAAPHTNSGNVICEPELK
jgi:hypothetical protein